MATKKISELKDGTIMSSTKVVGIEDINGGETLKYPLGTALNLKLDKNKLLDVDEWGTESAGDDHNTFSAFALDSKRQEIEARISALETKVTALINNSADGKEEPIEGPGTEEPIEDIEVGDDGAETDEEFEEGEVEAVEEVTP